jgi:hypothetical protein
VLLIFNQCKRAADFPENYSSSKRLSLKYNKFNKLFSIVKVTYSAIARPVKRPGENTGALDKNRGEALTASSVKISPTIPAAAEARGFCPYCPH